MPARQAQTVPDHGLDALLDEIDSTLATNAETFVRSFVQKGGQ
jgi:ubiquitin-like protein Pup